MLTLKLHPRHSISYKFYRDYGKHKFDPCLFLHTRKDDDVLDKVKKETKVIRKYLETVEITLSNTLSITCLI